MFAEAHLRRGRVGLLRPPGLGVLGGGDRDRRPRPPAAGGRAAGPAASSHYGTTSGASPSHSPWFVAVVTTLGSLYYSKVQGYVPCELCWYQRICGYPFAVILGIAAWRRDAGVRVYAVPVFAIGAVIAAYHSWIQAFPPADGTSFCTADVPCTTRYVYELGFVSLPFMALSAFVAMMALLFIARPSPRRSSLEESS